MATTIYSATDLLAIDSLITADIITAANETNVDMGSSTADIIDGYSVWYGEHVAYNDNSSIRAIYHVDSAALAYATEEGDLGLIDWDASLIGYTIEASN